jgi:anaerobic selenocysteine-containing dehydrogenase
VGEARSEWRTVAELAARVRPDLADRFAWPDNRALRAEIGRMVPAYAGIDELADTGDAVQYGGRHLCAGGEFPTPSGRARFSVVDVAPRRMGAGEWFVSTRRGKQFNSMIQGDTDPLTGAGRDAVYIDIADAAELGVGEGDPIRLVSDVGELVGRAKLVRLPARSLQVHWPEGNVLLPSGPGEREPLSRIPDYNAVVRVERAAEETGP